VPRKPRLAGGVKGHNINENSFPGSLALWAGSFTRVVDKIQRSILNIGIGRKKMKTYQAKKEELNPQWYLVNAEGKVLGRLATELVKVLKGKNKPTYTPHLDTGDFVIVVNAGKVSLTGKKMKDKVYYRHTGYPGGIKEMNAEKLLAKKPTEKTVWDVRCFEN